MIADLRADVKMDGSIKVDGKGLLLAGGNAIGGNANASVFATPICGAAAPFTLHRSNVAGVPLEANGDFRIDASRRCPRPIASAPCSSSAARAT